MSFLDKFKGKTTQITKAGVSNILGSSPNNPEVPQHKYRLLSLKMLIIHLLLTCLIYEDKRRIKQAVTNRNNNQKRNFKE